MGRGVLNRYKKLAQESGLSFSELALKEDRELALLLQSPPPAPQEDPRKEALNSLLPDLLTELKRRYVTVQLLWEEYIQQDPSGYQYTQFKKYLLEYKKNHDYSYHNTYAPAEQMQIDFAGDNLFLSDRKSDAKQKVVVLCGVLPHSGLGFGIALPKAGMEHFFYGLSMAMEHTGGVCQIIKSDNMKQWVKHTDHYEPTFSEAAMEWSLHYDTELDAARVSKPRDKGPVEGLVNKFYLFIYARLRNEIFYSLEELNTRIFELTDQYNHREIQKRGYSHFSVFQRDELPLLKPLPPEPFRFKYRKRFKVNSTYHVLAGKERHYYSIPYQYVGRQAVVVWDYESVEVYVENNRVACHKRSFEQDAYTTVDSHMPPNHLAYKRSREYNAAYYQMKASLIGSGTRIVIDKILSSKIFIQQSYKSCQGILSLASRYGEQRMEAACSRVGQSPVVNYKMIKNILQKNLDKATSSDDQIQTIPANDHVRGASSFC